MPDDSCPMCGLPLDSNDSFEFKWNYGEKYSYQYLYLCFECVTVIRTRWNAVAAQRDSYNTLREQAEREATERESIAQSNEG